MDYELKYVIAICLIVKIAALSPDLSINEETEKLEQIPTKLEAPLLPSLTAKKMLETSAGQYNQRTLFNWGSGRKKFNQMNNKKDVSKSERIIENQSFDTCEHKLELLQSSLKWRDIRKTLHWLGRILASNQTNIERCHKRKNLSSRSGFHADFYPSKKKSKKEKSLKRRKTTWARNLRNSSQTSSHSEQSKKFKKEHKKRYWKIHSRKGKSKRKEFQHDKIYKNADLINFSSTLHTAILKPNSVLFDFEKKFVKTMKTKGENFPSQKCYNASNSIKAVKSCELKTTEKVPQERERGSKNHTERSSSKEHNRENKAKSEKQKPWPHFVYHRVSSNFLHPELTGQNHGKSAYIAISVVSDDKSDSIDNNV